MVFPVVMYGCESWTIKKAEPWRTDAFELWCWRRLLRVSWTARRSNLSILKGISPGYSLEGLMLKLKLQYFGHLMQRADSFEKTLMLEKIEGEKRRGWWRMRWLDGITNSRFYSNSYPLSHNVIQLSHSLSSPSPLTFNLFQHQGLFQKVSYSHQVAKVLEPSASASVFPVNIQHWFPLGLTSLISLQSKGLSGVFSNTTVQKHQKYWVWFTVLSSRSL